MRVLYILHSSLMGGATVAAINLISNLQAQGVEPIIVVPKFERNIDNTTLINELDIKGWKHEQISVNALTGLYNPKNYMKNMYRAIRRRILHRLSLYQLGKIIKKYKPDIIHTNTGVVQEGYQLSKKYNIPHIWHIREYQDKDFSYKFIPSKEVVMQYYQDSNTVCITNQIQEYFGLHECESSRVIYDPLFSVNDVPLCPQNKDNYFLIASRLSPEKGIREIIEGFSKWNNSLSIHEKGKYKLIIAGEGKGAYYDNLKSLCRSLHTEDNIGFIGFQRDVKPLMRNAKALMVGSFAEGFGMMTAEANMMGCPVIGRNTDGTKEIISITGGGILFDTQADFLNAITRIANMSSVEICEKMIEPMQTARNEFNSERSAELIYKYYLDIIKK